MESRLTNEIINDEMNCETPRERNLDEPYKIRLVI